MDKSSSTRTRGFSFAIPALMDGCIGFVQTAVPLLAIRFGASPLFLGNMWSISQGARLPVCMTTGLLSEKVGRTRVIIPAAALATLTAIGLAFSANNAHIFVYYFFFMISVGAFYPSLQAFIGDNSAKGELRKNLSAFNIGWTIGGSACTLVAGYLFAAHKAWPFAVGALLAAGSIWFVRAWSRMHVSGGAQENGEGIDPMLLSSSTEGPGPLLMIARSAHFVGFFGYSAIRSMFPKLGYTLGYSDGAIGLLLGTMLVGQAVGIFIAGASPWWRGKLWPLVMALLMAIVSGLAIALVQSKALYAAAFLIQGISLGIAYTQALYYGLQARTKMGKNSGIHESLVAAGNISGGFVGGIAAQFISLRAPYAAFAVLSSLILIAGLIYWQVSPKPAS